MGGRIEIVREDHPFDRGYWKRYDGLPADGCASDQERDGWTTCDDDIRFEEAQKRLALSTHRVKT